MSRARNVIKEDVVYYKALAARYPNMKPSALKDVAKRSTSTIKAIVEGAYDVLLEEKPREADLFDFAKDERIEALAKRLDALERKVG